jgi:hypothetical protein
MYRKSPNPCPRRRKTPEIADALVLFWMTRTLQTWREARDGRNHPQMPVVIQELKKSMRSSDTGLRRRAAILLEYIDNWPPPGRKRPH